VLPASPKTRFAFSKQRKPERMSGSRRSLTETGLSLNIDLALGFGPIDASRGDSGNRVLHLSVS
jgi:hypothetical protein